MNTIISIIAIYGLSYFIKESDGPFDVMARLRNLLMRIPFAGVFFYKLLDCYFCVGCHAGWIVYLLSNPIANWSIPNFIVWVFAGGAFSYLTNAILSKLLQ